PATRHSSTLSLHDALPIFSVVTEVGEGTTFHVDLPRKKTSVAGPGAAPQAGQDDVSLRILHVDDDLDILSVTESAFAGRAIVRRSEEHTSELQSRENLVCR